ncbi:MULTISPECIES: hypothetical protein [Arcobacteraceae]|uniref:His-Xaa-Ser system protein HxsD n=1 Tax=Aliarcobacter butzleri L351 TaxID=1447259 RepID=A0A837J4A3_9BACT|nr:MULTISPECIES: hypothetical protein [Arcobacteraceae]KLE00149.1 hypothetical protein AF76_08495 [Aliarcobacter butzleri L351]KLE12299.1 hypothetical protein AF75_10075 [Aliarcobacter butzleri L350]MCT7910664.1 hypothetical protein [Arcobacter lacus]MDN5073759.1 hypothetical protein [Aliarcobacter butzleri]MDN5121069.1 hypothetical protein [Aliarcobacter butzleri]
MYRMAFLKNNYPEIIIRKTLYQFSKFTEWRFEEDIENWIIYIIIDENLEKNQNIFNRYLNDNLLRYEIDKSTFFLREQIIKKSLEKIYSEL